MWLSLYVAQDEIFDSMGRVLVVDPRRSGIAMIEEAMIERAISDDVSIDCRAKGRVVSGRTIDGSRPAGSVGRAVSNALASLCVPSLTTGSI